MALRRVGNRNGRVYGDLDQLSQPEVVAVGRNQPKPVFERHKRAYGGLDQLLQSEGNSAPQPQPKTNVNRKRRVSGGLPGLIDQPDIVDCTAASPEPSVVLHKRKPVLNLNERVYGGLDELSQTVPESESESLHRSKPNVNRKRRVLSESDEMSSNRRASAVEGSTQLQSVLNMNERVIGGINDLIQYNDPVDSNCSAPGPKVAYDNISLFQLPDGSYLIGLKHPTTFFFRGALNVRVVLGAATVLGYELSESDESATTVFSFDGFGAPGVETHPDSSIEFRSARKLIKSGVPRLTAEAAVRFLMPAGAVIRVESIANNFSHWIRIISASGLKLLPDLKKFSGHRLFPELEDFYSVPFDKFEGDRVTGKLFVMPQLKSFMEELKLTPPGEDGPKIIVCGGQNVGKSTAIRYLINSSLNLTSSALYIDLDLGQSEFTLCGCVSAVVVQKPLLGPNFTHLTTPIKSLYVGEIDVTQDIKGYLHCVSHLVEYCRKSPYSKLPWFINTMGMNRGIGLDVIGCAIHVIRPTHVIQICSENKRFNFSFSLTPQFIYSYMVTNFSEELTCDYKLVEVPSHSQLRKPNMSKELTSRTLREVVALTYLSHILQDFGKNKKCLNLCASRRNSDGGLSPATNLMSGEIVALCETFPDIVECHGFGLIYEVIEERPDWVCVSSSLPLAVLNTVNTICPCKVSLKASLALEYLSERFGTIPYMSSFDESKLLGKREANAKLIYRMCFNYD